MINLLRFPASLIFVLALLISINSPAQNEGAPTAPIEKFAVIVPVYRELYNQNLGTLLRSLYDQDLTGLPFQKLDVVFVVNNTADVNADIRIENQETVAFLRDLAAGKVARVNRAHRILRAIADRPLSKHLNIQVLDATTPGLPERNIGAVRDLGFKAYLRSLMGTSSSTLPLDRVLVAHLDADTGFGPDYVQRTVAAFRYEGLKFALMTMYYTDQPDSEARVYRRKITTDSLIAAYTFRLAYDGDMPYGGGPRIVSTARALVDVGGIPHEVVGEDSHLIKRLKEKFPGQGRFVDNPVFAKYRAREDGYDAAIYQKNLDHPVEFGQYELETEPLVRETLLSFQGDPLLKALYDEVHWRHQREEHAFVREVRKATATLIQDVIAGRPTTKSETEAPALTANPWFREMVTSKLKTYGPDERAVLASLTGEFPYYFSYTDVMMRIVRWRAAAETLLHRGYLNSGSSASAVEKVLYRARYLRTIEKRFPKTIEYFMHREPGAMCASLFYRAG